MHEFIIIIARLSELYVLDMECKNMYVAYYTDLSHLFALVRHFRNVYQLLVQLLPWRYIWEFNKEILPWYFVLLNQPNRKVFDFVYLMLSWLLSFNVCVRDLSENMIRQHTTRKLIIHPEKNDRWRDDQVWCNCKLFMLHKLAQCHRCDVLIYK